MKSRSTIILLIVSCILMFSCKKSANEISNPIETQYKSLNSENVNTFFLENSTARRGCAGANCSSSFDFGFKNLSYATDISIYIGAFQTEIKSIWSYYNSEKETIKTFGKYDAKEYKLKYSLKDGRVLITSWTTF